VGRYSCSELAGCPHCGARLKINTNGAGEEVSARCTRGKRCTFNGERTKFEPSKLYPENIGSYIPEARWAEKFRSHPAVSRVTVKPS
jgi:hypothetical protein